MSGGLLSWQKHHQRRLILLRCVNSFAPESKLIDLTTVRVAALPLSRLEGWCKTFLLTTTRVRQNRVLSANASIHDKVGVCGFVFWFGLEEILRASAVERSESRRDSGKTHERSEGCRSGAMTSFQFILKSYFFSLLGLLR